MILCKEDDFFKKCSKKHDNKYDYSSSKYINSRSDITINCPTHGSFTKNANIHCQSNSRSAGCELCYDEYKISSLIESFIKIHGDKYDYSKINNYQYNSYIDIICNKCNNSWKSLVSNHLAGCSCPYCLNRKITTESVIHEFKEIHGDKYNYSNVIYEKAKSPVTIICKKHNLKFELMPDNHKRGMGCPKCSPKNKTNESIIEEFILIHGDKYDYSKVEYIKAKRKVIIICKKHNEEFPQTPDKHLKGEGCPKCKQSFGEKAIVKILNDLNIRFIPQKTFDDCRYKLKLQFDFYLPDYNLCIEFQGRQHYESIAFFGGEEGFKLNQIRDNIKKEYCLKENTPSLLIIPHWDQHNIKYIIINTLELV